MKILRTSIFLFSFLMASAASAMNLTEAKSMGLVGETPQGYIAAVSTPDDATRNLIKTVNEKRRTRYRRIAQDNGTSLEAVELVAGEKAIRKTRPGHYILQNGAWIRK